MAIFAVNARPLSSAYSVSGAELLSAYDESGGIVFTKTDYSTYQKTQFLSAGISSTQGFDIYNGVIFQFVTPTSAGNKMTTVNTSTESIIASQISCASDHGDSASFSDEFYESDDSFPLLYVTADTNPAKVYVNRVTTTSSQLVKTLSFPLDKAGYYAALCLDVENSIAYMVGYSKKNYQTDDSGTNKTVISKWDLSSLAENQDGSFTPAFLSRIERPFIYVMQGQQFHDGMLWIASGGSNYNGYVYALDPNNGELLHSVNSGTTVEIEGIAWISNNEMITGHQGGTYYKFTFES